MRDRTRGLLITLAGVLLLTPDALLIRLVGAGSWTLLFWRGIGFFTVVGGFCLWRHRGRLRAAAAAAGAGGVAVALLFTLSSGAFLWSIGHTHAANTLVIVAVSPLFAAFWSFVLLGERPRRDTLLAIAAALAGVAVTVSGSLGGIHLAGDLAALLSALLMALNFTLVRRLRSRDLVPAYALAGLFMAALGAAAADGLAVPPDRVVWLVLLAFVVLPLSFTLVMTGPRYLQSAEVALLMLLETALGPLWVWLVLGEEPPAATLVGGTAIVLTLLLYAGNRLRRQRADAVAPVAAEPPAAAAACGRPPPARC